MLCDAPHLAQDSSSQFAPKIQCWIQELQDLSCRFGPIQTNCTPRPVASVRAAMPSVAPPHKQHELLLLLARRATHTATGGATAPCDSPTITPGPSFPQLRLQRPSPAAGVPAAGRQCCSVAGHRAPVTATTAAAPPSGACPQKLCHNHAARSCAARCCCCCC